MVLPPGMGAPSGEAGQQGPEVDARLGIKKPPGGSEAKATGQTQLPARARIVPIHLMHKSLLWLLETLEQMRGHGILDSPLAF